MSIKKAALVGSLIAATLGVTSNAQAFDASKLTMRVRIIDIVPADKSDAIPGLVVKDGIDLSNKVAPDIDFEYALSPHVGLELLLSVPQRHDVTAHLEGGGTYNLGSVQHLPPTLTAKYYFLTDKVRPYVGGGLNFTWITDDALYLAGTHLDIDRTSIGVALQAGVDVSLTGKWSLSIDAKKADISTDVSLHGTKLSTVSVDPYIYGAGIGYRF